MCLHANFFNIQLPSSNKIIILLLPQIYLSVLLFAVERLIRDNCQIDGDDLINYADFVQSISQRYDEMDSEHY